VTPKIAMLAASDETQNALRAWALRAGFDLTRTHGGREIADDQFDFHITLLATAEPVFIPQTDHQIEPLHVDRVGFDVLGKDGDVPVLLVQAEGVLGQGRAFFMQFYGAEPTFADFKPHITLSYAWDGDPALADLEPPSFPLLFDRLIVQDLDPEHKARLMRRQTKAVVGAHGLYR
jgi:hypothetical protein